MRLSRFPTGLGSIPPIVVPLFIGPVSDMCRNKWGRRRPFIIVGSVLTTVSVFLLWHAVEYRNPFRTSKETITSLSPVPRSHLFSSASPSSLRRGDNDDNASPSLLPSELSNDYLSAQFVYFLLAVFAIRTFENVAASAFCGLVPDTVHPSQRGVVSGYLAAMATLGTLCGIVTSGFFIVSHSFAVYLSLSVCYLVSMLLTVTGTQETSFQRKNLPSFSFYQNLKSLFVSPYEHPNYWWVWLTRFVVMMGFNGMQPFWLYFLRDDVKVNSPEKTMAKLTVIILISSSVGGYLGGYFSDKCGRKFFIYVTTGIMAVVSVALPLAAPFLLLVTGLGVLFGIAFGTYLSAEWALCTDVLPDIINHAAKDMAVWHIALSLPQSLAAPVVGFVLALPGQDESNHYKPLGYLLLFSFSGFFFVMASFCVSRVKNVK